MTNSGHEMKSGATTEPKQPPVSIVVIPVTPFQQNCSLIWSPETKKGAVVDPGGDVETIVKVIKEYGVEVEKIILTHGHIDHIGGAADLAAQLGVKVIGPHKADEPLIERVADQAKQFGLPDVKPVRPDEWLDEGDMVEFAGRNFEVLHCPGHAPGHVVFFDRDLRFAFSGDVLFAGSIGRTDLPLGDHDTLIRSIKEKMLPLGDDVSFLPGHGEASTIGHERQTNPFFK
ncbi:beta-lactamase domain protein [Roseibium sp. TrichSKD4]|nr:beta-lactamase domain protein [Roseibium sp. TrichSKD4]